MTSTFKAMKTHKDNSIHICPNCSSKDTNPVTKSTYYCKNCYIEFNSKGKKYTILYDGTLVDHHINEFADIY